MCANESMHKQSCIHESRVFMSFVRYEKAGVRPKTPKQSTQTLIGSDLAASRDLAEG